MTSMRPQLLVLLVVVVQKVSATTRVAVNSQGEIVHEHALLAIASSLQRKSTAASADLSLVPSELVGFEYVDGGIDRACRRHSIADNDSSFYEAKQAVSLNACAAMCLLSQTCKGVEYHVSGRCELWKETISSAATAHSYRCLRRIETTSTQLPFFASVDGGSDRSCLNADSSSRSEDHYPVAANVDLELCKALCALESSCKGIEHNSQGQCEIWTQLQDNQATFHENGASCLRRTRHRQEVLTGGSVGQVDDDADCQSPKWPGCRYLSGRCCPHADGSMLQCCFSAPDADSTLSPSEEVPQRTKAATTTATKAATTTTTTTSTANQDNEVISGWSSSGKTLGRFWCKADVPTEDWSLARKCTGGTEIKVLTYNLFWWNLFGLRGGNGGSAGKHIAHHGPYDMIGFQECDDPARVLNDGGLGNSMRTVAGRHALAIAYNQSTWQLLASDVDEIGEDRRDQFYGRRAMQWARLLHKASGKTVFFVNHHGPLPVNTGGLCAGKATAFNILRVIGLKSRAGDAKVLVGDFNADRHSETQRTIADRMHHITSHWVDSIFASCEGTGSRNIGSGGSDHDALEAVFNV